MGEGSGWDLVPLSRDRHSNLNGGWPLEVPKDWALTEQFCKDWAFVSRNVSKQVVFTVLKTWANSWCTTTRLHEAVVWPCIFGCPNEEDSLSHYLRCTRFWSGIGTSARADGLIYEDPLIKISLSFPYVEWSKLIVVASRCYHSIKFDHLHEVERAIESGLSVQIEQLLEELAAHFCSEIGVT